MPDASDLVLTIAGTQWSGWTHIEICRRMEQVATTFRLGVTDRWAAADQPMPLRPGSACRLAWAGITLLSGYIDEVEVSYDAGQHRVTVSGRDVTGDLVDDAAVVDGDHEWHGLTLDAIVTRICQPYGIAVRPLVDMGAAFPRFSLQPGETAWSAIERACRARAVLAIGDGAGGLVLTQAGSDPTPAVSGAGAIDVSGTWSFADRHSLIVVRGQQESVSGQDDPAACAGPEARVSDPAIGRYRPKVLLAEGQGSAATLADRAAWELRVSAGRSRRVRLTVSGWVQPGSTTLWQINRPITLDEARLDLAGETLLVVGVTFTLDEGGSRTVLEIAPPDAFAPEPASETGDEGIWQ